MNPVAMMVRSIRCLVNCCLETITSRKKLERAPLPTEDPTYLSDDDNDDDDSEPTDDNMFQRNRRITVFSVFADVVLYIVLAVVVLLMSYNKLGLEPFYRGLFCNDQTIQYPYHPDSVSDTLVAIVGIAAPFVMMFLLEAVHVLRHKQEQPGCSRAKVYATIMYRTVGPFLLGALLTMTFTEVTKLLAGRLRPHFLDVCRPDFTKVNCADGFVMLSDDLCRGNVTESRLLDARKSFPSGHASLSFYGLIYLIIYLQMRYPWKQYSRVFLCTIQCACACVAIYFSISRVNDNKHHFGDVIAGALLGIVMSLLTIKYNSSLVKPHQELTVTEKTLPLKLKPANGLGTVAVPVSDVSIEISDKL